MNDQFSGMGGSYIIDEKTGERKPVERTAEAKPEAPAALLPEVSYQPAAKTATDKRG